MVVHVVGAGLAGSEAAHFLAKNGVSVHLHEMRPERLTEAHKTGRAAELVCSNSLKSKAPGSAPWILKEEMRRMGSLVLSAAAKSEVPGGDALSVERDLFSTFIDESLSSHPLIRRIPGTVEKPFDGEPTIFATGPLTAQGLGEWIARASGNRALYFYDAIAPIVETSSIDEEKSFLANRYGKGGEAAYINCPLSREEYEAFVDALLSGDKVPPKDFEKEIYFAGCQPIEAIAASGRESLRFGPMKPVGLQDPKTGSRPYAAVQLRPENRSGTAYNLVGFQTRLKYGAQGKALRLIPALANAEFLRMGSIHRNTYVNGPRALRSDLSLKGHPLVTLAGQITGVEGYLESAAIGLLAANFVLQRLRGVPVDPPPPSTAMGALLRHVIASDPDSYQPMNIQFGIFDPADFQGLSAQKKDQLRSEMARQAPENFAHWWKSQSLLSDLVPALPA